MEGLLVLLAVVLGTVLAVVVTVLLVVGLGVRLTARSVQRANRVSPNVVSEAPLLWRWSFAQAARQHRRLQRVAAAARASRAAAGVTAEAVADLAADIERQACALDDQLALSARMPTNERLRRVHALDGAITELEQVVVRLGVLAAERRPTPTSAPSLTDRIAALEHGRDEVARIEAEAWGELHAVDALGRALASGAPAGTKAAQPQPAPSVRRR